MTTRAGRLRPRRYIVSVVVIDMIVIDMGGTRFLKAVSAKIGRWDLALFAGHHGRFAVTGQAGAECRQSLARFSGRDFETQRLGDRAVDGNPLQVWPGFSL